jgi:hypothetical protein
MQPYYSALGLGLRFKYHENTHVNVMIHSYTGLRLAESNGQGPSIASSRPCQIRLDLAPVNSLESPAPDRVR